MKPVAIFRHVAIEGPGYLADFLDARTIPWRLVRIDEGDPLPLSVQEYGGIVLMGGPMSVNDDLPWISPLLALIRDAVEADIPVLGHCLGGQLMSKALGAGVGPNAVKEIGWGGVRVHNAEEARRWFGERAEFTVFHWHGETFDLPAGAVHLLSSAHCRHQAYALGKHLALQCHIEMTADMVRDWCRAGAAELAAARQIGVQQVAEIERDLPRRVEALHAVADRVYAHWTAGLAK
jgi:GMP synthase-like glutamine amidotransferase